MNDYKMNFMHLCDDAIFSQEGKLSLIGIFEVINLTNLPGSLLKAFLVFNLSVFNQKINVVDLDISMVNSKSGEETFKLPTVSPSIKWVEGNKEAKLGITLQLVNVTFKEEGMYKIEIKSKNVLIGSLDFQVNLLKQKKGEVN